MAHSTAKWWFASVTLALMTSSVLAGLNTLDENDEDAGKCSDPRLLKTCSACVREVQTFAIQQCCADANLFSLCRTLVAEATDETMRVLEETLKNLDGGEDGDSFDMEKRGRMPFLGKRVRYNSYLGKRPRNNFLGKRSADESLTAEDLVEDKRARYMLGKRLNPFLGKRGARYSLGKRDDESMQDTLQDEEEKRARNNFLGKRMRYMLGKRARYMLGKRADDGDAEEQEPEKRARYMLGKRSADPLPAEAHVAEGAAEA